MTETHTIILIIIVGTIMVSLAGIDWLSSRRGKHLDFNSTIVSLGLLGTFVGIVLGLLNFDTQDITASVPPLLEGLKFAFITSIFGMFLSVLLSVLQAKPEEIDEKDHEYLLRGLLSDIKQQLKTVNKTLETGFKSVNKTSETGFKGTHERLAEISETVTQLRSDIYQRRHRFSKIDSEGQALPDSATQWAAIVDNETGLSWEVKTSDGGLRDGQHTYSWYAPGSEIVGEENGGQCEGCRCDTAAYVEAVNQKQLAGYSEWRLPTMAELESLVKEGIDKRYFPNIQSSGWYFSSSFHSGEGKGFLLFCFEGGYSGINMGDEYGYILLVG
jgi:hypothetical protein